MSQILKVNGDFKPVSVFDAQGYTNDAAVFQGTAASGAAITVSNLNGTLAVGKSVYGVGIPEGAYIVSIVGSTMTISAPITQALSATPLAAKTLFVQAQTVQPQGPKLQFFTVADTNIAYQLQAMVRAVEQLATVHLYEVIDLDTVAFATYSTEAWTAAGAQAAIDAATGATTTVTAGASFSSF